MAVLSSQERTIIPTDPAGATALIRMGADGINLGSSGAANNATKTAKAIKAPYGAERWDLPAQRVSYWTIGDMTLGNALTVCQFIKWNDHSNRRCSGNGTNDWTLGENTNDVFLLAGGVVVRSSLGAINRPHLIVGQYNGAAQTAIVTADGKTIASTMTGTPGTTIGAKTGFYVGHVNPAAPSAQFCGEHSFLAVYASLLTPTQIRSIFTQFSQLTRDISIDALDTCTGITSGHIPGSSTIRVTSGTWSVSSSPRKCIACEAAGALTMPIPESYSIRTSLIWASGTQSFGFANLAGAPNATSQSGYWVQCDTGTLRLVKSVAGVATTLASGGTIVAGTEYDVQLSWDVDGALNLEYRATGSSIWLVACTATDTAVGAATRVNFYSSAAGNKWTRRISTNRIALLGSEWGVQA